MLCQRCKKNIANVHFTQIINNKKIEMYLCEQCANHENKFDLGSPISISDFFSGLIVHGNASAYITSEQDDIVCDSCGMSYSDFQKIGKLGCSGCYSVYGDKLRPILKRLHGSVQHTGKMPGRVSKSLKFTREIDSLKEMLNKAVQKEEYEKAAEIRDKIRDIEGSRS